MSKLTICPRTVRHITLVAALLLFSGCATLEPERDSTASQTPGPAPQPEPELVVNVEDLQARVNIDNEQVREDTLQTAFYEAVERTGAIGDYEFEYNSVVPEEARGYLEFSVVNWERTASGFFECSVSATFHDLDGDVTELGLFHGLRSGITVSTPRDLAEQFMRAAQEAFEQALRELEEKTETA